MPDDLTERLRRVLEEEGFLRRTATATYHIGLQATADRLAEEARDWHGAEMIRAHNETAATFERSWLKARERAEQAERELGECREAYDSIARRQP